MTNELGMLFEYDDWANRQTLNSLRRVAHPPERAVEIMGHIIGAQLLWEGRMEGSEQPIFEVWPKLSLDDCGELLDALKATWSLVLQKLSTIDAAEKDAALIRPVSYTNSKGEKWTSSLREILLHLISHGSYHRGQIALLMGRAGHQPAYTDLIQALRGGHVSW